MARFLYLGKYTAEGLKGLVAEGGSKRRDATEQMVKSIGGRVLEYDFTVGEYDFILMVEVEDQLAGLVAPLLAGSSGTVRVVTVPLVSPQQMDDVAARAVATSFRPAGH